MTIPTPLVSCIMLTRERRDFIPFAIRYFIQQDYPTKELIIVDDGYDPVDDLIPDGHPVRYIHTGNRLTIGAKRNLACDMAQGDIIVHWDDDDWMAWWRLSYQVTELLRSRMDICGLCRILYFDIQSNLAWKYIHVSKLKPWIAGNTFCYKKSFWQQKPFPEINIGEDNLFLGSRIPKKIVPLKKTNFIIALIHCSNASPKLKGNNWYSYPETLIYRILGNDLKPYRLLASRIQANQTDLD